MPILLSTLAATRDLTLAQLHGFGLRRLGLSRPDLIETEADRYVESVRWAQAIHACSNRIDGMCWISRQHDTAFALVLFGDRVRRRDLILIEPPLPLYSDPGFEIVHRAAEQAGITVLVVPE